MSPKPADKLIDRLRPRLLAHDGSVALIDQGFMSATNFLTSLLIGRFAGKTELGLYLLAWTAVVIVNDLVAAVITTPYVVISPGLSEKQQRGYRGSVLIHQFTLALLAACCLFIVGVHLRRGDKAGLATVLVVLSGLIVILVFKEFARRMWFAHLEMRRAAVADVGSCLLQLVGIFLLVKEHCLSAKTSYMVIAISALLPCATWIGSYRSRVSINTRAAILDFGKNWELARWVAGSGSLWAAAMYTYPWLLVWTHGTSATGIWAACYGLAALSNPVLIGFGNYLGPRIALLQCRAGVAAMRSYVFRSSGVFVALLLPFALIVWFWGDFLVAHLYGAAFAGHDLTIKILAANVLALGAIYPLSRGFFALQRAELDFYINIVAVAVLAIAGVALVRSHGVIGAALGLTLTNLVTGALRAAVFFRVTHPQSRSSAKQFRQPENGEALEVFAETVMPGSQGERYSA